MINTTPKELITKEEAIERYGELNVWEFENGDWGYYDEDDYEHLMRKIDEKWVELTEGIKAREVWSCKNGDWRYADENGKRHRVKFDLSKYKTEQKDIPSGNLITKEEAIAKYGEDSVWSWPGGDWGYYDADGWVHLMRKIDGLNVLRHIQPEIGVITTKMTMSI
jgi:hypothetical protein